jgi:hypothetical protein
MELVSLPPRLTISRTIILTNLQCGRIVLRYSNPLNPR